MRGKATALMIVGLVLAAPRASAQQSDLLPQRELREHLRQLRSELAFSSRERATRVRAQVLASARTARLEARHSAQLRRELARTRFERVRPLLMREPRIRVRARRRDI